MLVTERERLKDDIAAWTGTLGNGRTALIPILQEVQRKHGHISDFAMQVVADTLDIHPVEVFSVVSFYSFLDFEPLGRFVRLCRPIS